MTTWLNVKNNAQSALASSLTAVATSLSLLSGEGAKFPTANFNISIDDEILLCTTRTADVLTVTRAQESTTAAAHSAGATVTLNVTAAIIAQLQAAIDRAGLTNIRAEPNAEQVIPQTTVVPLLLDNEILDVANEYDNTVKTGTATSTSASHLVDATNHPFTAADVGKTVWNTTTNGYATVTVYNSASDVTLSSDIFTSGAGYKMYWSRFLCAVAGTYLVTGSIRFPSTTIVANKYYQAIVYKNSTTQSALSALHSALVGSLIVPFVTTVTLAVNDYLQLAVYHGAGTNVNVSTSNLVQTNFNIFRLI